MTYEIELSYCVLVDAEAGGEEAARRIARDHVANDRCIFEREGIAMGVGYFVLKGMSAEVVSCRPFVGNRRVVRPQQECRSDEEGS